MDYVVGSVAALISGNVTPNRPKQLKKAQTPIKHQPSPNVTPKSELVEDRSIFLSPTLQKKKAIVKKSPKRIFQNPDLEVTNGEDHDSSVLSPKADKVKKHLKDDLEADSSSASILVSPKSPKNVGKSPNKANKKRLSGNDTKEADSLVETVFLSAKSLRKNDDKSSKPNKKRLCDIGNTNEIMPKKKQRLSQNENQDDCIKLNETDNNSLGSTPNTPKKKVKRGNSVGEICTENSPANGDISMTKIVQQIETSLEETNTINGIGSPKKKNKKRNKSQNRNSSQSELTCIENSNSAAIQEGAKVSEMKESDPKPSINASDNMKKKNKKRNKSKQKRNNAENKSSGSINPNTVTNENTKSKISNETANNIATVSNVNHGTKKKNKKRNKSKQKQNNIQNESKVNEDSVTNMEVDSSIVKEMEVKKNCTNASNTDNQSPKNKKNKKRNKSKRKNNVETESTDNINPDNKSNMEVDTEDENELEKNKANKNITVTENVIKTKSHKKKNKSKQNDNDDESIGNEGLEVNPNAVTSQDTDSEHESDDDINSEDEEINKKVLDTGVEADSSDEEPDAQNKKKAPPQQKNEQKTTGEASGTEERDLEEETRRTLFVGNVPFSNKCKRDIKRIFKQYGDVETVRIRTVPAKDARYSPKLAVIKNELHPDRTTVNIYVRFADESSVQKAVAANNSIYNGCHLRVQRSDSPGAPHDARCAVFVGNLPFTLEDEALRAKFETCGEIDSVRIVRDRKTQAGKGFGYVNFKSKDGVELALALTDEDLTIKNRILRVKRCTQPTQNQLGRRQRVKNPGKNETGQTARGNFGQNNRFGKKDNFKPRQHQGNKANFAPGKFSKGQNDDKNNGAYRRLMNKRKNQDTSDGPPNKKQHTDTHREKKERKEFVGVTAEKKRKNKFNKGQKKKKILSEILTK